MINPRIVPLVSRRLWRTRTLLLMLATLLLLAACTSPVVYDPSVTVPPAAEPAATLPPAPEPPATQPPAAPAAPADPALIARIGINPAQVSLNTQGLPLVWRVNAVAGTPVTTDATGASTGLPDHLQVNFGTLDAAQRQPGDPVLYVIPLDAYLAQWQDAGNGAVANTVQAIFDRSVALPNPPPLRNLPALPFEVAGGRQDFATQVGVPSESPFSSSKNGFRFVGRFVQESTPVTNEQMQYVYQGFTNDGAFLVAFFFPAITNPALPATAANLTDAQRTEFEAGQDAALAATAVTLASDATSAWTPDVATLDAIVASLALPGIPENALVGNAWTLVATSDGITETAFAGSGNYHVTFNAGGSMNFTADCNVGSGQFVASGGVAGSIAIQPGPTTLVACPEGSFADTFLSSLTNAQAFRLRPGGDVLEIVGAPGSLSLLLRPLGAPDAVAPTPDAPVVEIPTPEPQLPMGTVIGAQGANIRSGPGTNFPIIGFAPAGTTGLITGQSAAGDWYVVSAPTLPSGVGWINAPLVATTNAGNLPVIVSPATPVPTATPVVPTATPTQVPPTATPSASINFTADRTRINQGECVTLSWNVQNVRAVWVYPLGANFRDFPVAGQGARQECPNTTTTYEMRVELTNGLLELRQVTINVTAANPLASTNWVVTTLVGGQIPTGDQPPTLSLAADGTFSGFGGCNTVTGTYTVTGARISFTLNASTLVACDEKTAWIQDGFQNALASTAFFDFLGFQLVFRDFGGNEMLRMIATS